VISFLDLHKMSVDVEEDHSCVVMLNSSNNSSACNVNDKAKCPSKTCDKGVRICVSVYTNRTGRLKPIYMNCDPNPGHQPISTCGTNSCVLEFNNGHYTCCCYENMCNINVTLPKIHPTAKTTAEVYPGSGGAKSADRMLLAYILAPVFLLMLMCIVVAHFFRRHKDTTRQEIDHLLEPPETLSPTINKSVVMLETIHEGQFSNVLRANYGHEVVAVKNILPTQSDLWLNEKDIYEKCSLHHHNVLRFIAAEKIQEDNITKYWIITEFCSNGSLADYLQKYTLGMSDLIRMTLCILKGLDYLHSSNQSSSVTVAHRDLKSSNILVKSDLTCCIADFGLSLSFPYSSMYTNLQQSTDMSQVGTRRYMAPEVLRGAMTFTRECFIAVDMYAFALVAWELLSRTSVAGVEAKPYELPYATDVGQHPSLENMIQCVVEHKKRPRLENKWREDSILNVLCETIEECWDIDAYARISARLAYLRLSGVSVQTSSIDSNASMSKDNVEFLSPAVETTAQSIML